MFYFRQENRSTRMKIIRQNSMWIIGQEKEYTPGVCFTKPNN